MQKDEFIEKAVSDYIKLNDTQKAYVLGFMSSAVMYSKPETKDEAKEEKPEKTS